MVIKIQNKKTIQAPRQTKFTSEQLDKFFKVDNWHEFYKKHENKFWEKNLNIYDWICYPCIYQDIDEYGHKWYRCMVHETVTTRPGDKKTHTFFMKNINFESLVAHMLDYEPEKHKEYISEKLFGSNVTKDT